MTGFAVYYILANVVAIVLFGILLIYNRLNIDRQDKQIQFDYVLIAFMLYFVTDSFWAAINTEMLPKTKFSVVLISFLIYIFMAGMIFCWFNYVLAVEQVPNRDKAGHRLAHLLPFILVTVVLIVNYIIAPQFLLDSQLNSTSGYSIYLMSVPCIYLVAILFLTIRRAGREDSMSAKRSHYSVGLMPFGAFIIGIIQELFFPSLPVYCSAVMILMMTFYIQSINVQVSVDPLTRLNNRGQLKRYTSQKSNLFMEDRRTIVVMMDINKFKMINDTYGHAEGDRALVIIADVLRKTIANYKMPAFIGRYGGDEFILIIHPDCDEDPDQMIADIRSKMALALKAEETPYALDVSMGYDEITGEDDNFQNSIQRADEKLYIEKKIHGAGR